MFYSTGRRGQRTGYQSADIETNAYRAGRNWVTGWTDYYGAGTGAAARPGMIQIYYTANLCATNCQPPPSAINREF